MREEAEHFNVDVTDFFVNILTNLEKTEVESFIIEQKRAYKRDFSVYDENIYVANVIKQYVDNIKNSIPIYFKYKSGYNRHRDPYKMRYFDNHNKRDVKTSYSLSRDYFSTFKYYVQIDPQDQRLYG